MAGEPGFPRLTEPFAPGSAAAVVDDRHGGPPVPDWRRARGTSTPGPPRRSAASTAVAALVHETVLGDDGEMAMVEREDGFLVPAGDPEHDEG